MKRLPPQPQQQTIAHSLQTAAFPNLAPSRAKRSAKAEKTEGPATDVHGLHRKLPKSLTSDDGLVGAGALAWEP